MTKFKYAFDDNKRYHTWNYYLRNTFGEKVFKVSLNGGFTCPNLDGKVSRGGCTYCSNSGSGDFAGNPASPLSEQFNEIKAMMHKKWPNAKYIAYFQAYTNTYAPLNVLKDKFEEALSFENVIGLSISTRPDCLEDDVVEYFVQKSIANGIDIIRIFDCLNDIRNLQTAVTACNKENGHAQVALSYTLGDAYTLEYWMDMAKRVEDMGANSLCIKDMAGLLVPSKATELVQALKDSTSLPIELHTHYTSGVASMTYMKAVEAGCDIIDTAMSPFAMGTSQPATEVMVETFKGTPYDTGLDQNKLAEIADYFRPMRDEALDTGLLNPKNLGVNIKTLLYQVPGGMLSNLTSQLKEQHAEDKYYDVLEEVPRVRKDLGECPLVTPSSQIVGTQAVFNVLMGERYKMVTKETKDVLAGKYGATVKPFNPEVQKKCIGDTEPITCRYADLLEPELPKLEKEIEQWKQQDEDVLTYALFPQVAVDFFKYREAQQTKVDPAAADKKDGAYPV